MIESIESRVRPEERQFASQLEGLLQARNASAAVSAWLDECAHTCQERRQTLDEDAAQLAHAHGTSLLGVTPAGARERRLGAVMCEERDTWRLVHSLWRENLLLASPSDDLPCPSSLDLTADEVVEQCDARERTLRRRKCVLYWLEAGAKERVEFFDAEHGAPRNAWSATLERLDTSQSAHQQGHHGRVSALDPDAPIRAARGTKGWGLLDSPDEEDETELLSSVWQYVRAGEVEEAASLCEDQGHIWRAVSLRGGKCHGVAYVSDGPGDGMEAEVSSRRLESVGNPQRPLWKRMCWNLARRAHASACASTSVGTATFEAAIYAALAGDLDTLLASPLCRSWEDQCWAHFMSMRESALDTALAKHANAQRCVSALYSSASVCAKRLEQEQLDATTHVARLSEIEVVAALRASSYPVVNQAATSKQHLVQSAMVIGSTIEIARLVSAVLLPMRHRASTQVQAWSGAGDSTDERESSPQLLRFAAHFVIFLRIACATALGDVASECDEIIAAYVEHLGRHRQVHLVALYVGQLEARATRVQAYSAFLRSILQEEDRRTCIALAQRHFPDELSEIVLRTVEETRRDNSAGASRDDAGAAGAGSGAGVSMTDSGATVSRNELEQLRALQWLTIDPAHAGEAVAQANAMLRDFVKEAGGGNVGALEAAQLLVDRFLPEEAADAVEHYAQAPGGITGRSCAEWCAVLKEHCCWRALLQAYSTFDAWRSSLVVCTPEPAPRAPTLGLAVGHQAVEASMIYKRTLRVWQEELEAKVESLSRAAMLASAHLRNMLSFPREPHLIEDDALAISLSTTQCQLLESLGVPPDGWLQFGGVDGGDASLFGGDQQALLDALRRQCLMQALFMLHQVLHETAEWNLRFAQTSNARSFFAQAWQVSELVASGTALATLMTPAQSSALVERLQRSAAALAQSNAPAASLTSLME
jgi:nuclear pore complex protein Nup107